MENHQETREQVKVKQVTFSEVSKLYTYHEDRPQRERLFYSKMDFHVFQKDASTTAFHLRRQAELSHQDDESFTLSEPESWLPSPRILKEADTSIDPEEVIGLELTIVSERTMQFLDALKMNHKFWVLADLNHSERVRAMIANASTVASYIAHCKAKNVSDYCSY